MKGFTFGAILFLLLLDPLFLSLTGTTSLIGPAKSTAYQKKGKVKRQMMNSCLTLPFHLIHHQIGRRKLHDRHACSQMNGSLAHLVHVLVTFCRARDPMHPFSLCISLLFIFFASFVIIEKRGYEKRLRPEKDAYSGILVPFLLSLSVYAVCL